MTTELQIVKAAAEAAFHAADKAQAIAEAAKLVQDGTVLGFLAQATQDMADEATNHWEAIAGYWEEGDEEVREQIDLAKDAFFFADGASIFVEELAAQFSA